MGRVGFGVDLNLFFKQPTFPLSRAASMSLTFAGAV